MNLSCVYDKKNVENTLIGKWEFESLSTVFKEQFSHKPYPHQCLLKKDFLEFLENDILKSFDFDTTCKADILEGKWRLNKDELTLIGSDIPTIMYKVVVIDSSTLKITHHNSEYSISLNLKRI